MCIAYLAIGVDPRWPLFVAANRDESHARPTRSAAPWLETPEIIGGQDKEAGGTWFAVHHQGRFALLTNYRDRRPATGLERSRGALCTDYLIAPDSTSPKDYMNAVSQAAEQYQGFNLIIGQWQPETRQFDCYYYSNRSERPPVTLVAGHYVVSNHLLNTPWPKSQRLQQNLQQHVAQERLMDVDAAYQLLRDEQKAPLAKLPNTGLDTQTELLISSPFIINSSYGTRSSAVWAVDSSGYSVFNECSYTPQGVETERHSWPIMF